MGTPRGIRNNNPGNIEYGSFTRRYGAIGSDGRFARFPSPEAGLAAIIALQRSYEGRGLNTVRQRIARWAPSSENGSASTNAYVNRVANEMGIGPDTPFSISDPRLGPAFLRGMVAHENGRQPYSASQIMAGFGGGVDMAYAPAPAAIPATAAVNAMAPMVPRAPSPPTPMMPTLPDIPFMGGQPQGDPYGMVGASANQVMPPIMPLPPPSIPTVPMPGAVLPAQAGGSSVLPPSHSARPSFASLLAQVTAAAQNGTPWQSMFRQPGAQGGGIVAGPSGYYSYDKKQNTYTDLRTGRVHPLNPR